MLFSLVLGHDGLSERILDSELNYSNLIHVCHDQLMIIIEYISIGLAGEYLTIDMSPSGL